MKKLLLAFMLLFIMTAGMCFAGDEFDLDEHKDEILEYLRNENAYEGSEYHSDSILIDEAYYVKVLTPLMITEYKKTGSLAEIVSDEWDFDRVEVPFRSSEGSLGVVSLAYEKGSFRELGRKVQNTEGGRSGYIFLSSDAMTVIDNELKNAEKIEIYKNQMYYITLVYVVSDGSEYVIPYNESIYDIKAFENGKVYPVKEFFDRLDREFDEDYIIENPESNGGIPLREDTGNSVIKPYSDAALEKLNITAEAENTAAGTEEVVKALGTKAGIAPAADSSSGSDKNNAGFYIMIAAIAAVLCTLIAVVCVKAVKKK